MAAARIYLVIGIILATASRLEAASACAPDCENASEGQRVAVPWDCTKYSTCADLHNDGILWPSEPVSCDSGFFFSELVGICEPIALAPPDFCQNSCSPCVPYYTFAGDTTPHEADCNSFYLNAAEGVLIQTDCDADKPYYNYRNGQCQTYEGYCYNFCNPCQYYCIGIGNVPDPADCRSFYQCNPPDVARFTCPADEYFDRNSGVCSADAACIQEC